MEALKLGALLGGNDGVRVGHASMLVPSGAIRLGRGNSDRNGTLSSAPARTGAPPFSTTIRMYLLTTIRGHAKDSFILVVPGRVRRGSDKPDARTRRGKEETALFDIVRWE
jgi:hypothetical protein